MFRPLAAAVAVIACAGMAMAQERAAPILDILGRLPLPPGEGIVEIDYGNPVPVRGAAAMAAALGQMDDDPTLAPLLRTAPTLFAQRSVDALDTLPQSHGIDLLQVERFATMVRMPDRAAVLMLPEGSGAGVGAAVRAADLAYRDRPFLGETVLWRGEVLATNLDQRDDFFGYGLGISSRLWVDGDLVIQTASWPTMERAITAPEGTVGASAAASALVSVLDDLPGIPGQVVALRLYLDLPWPELGPAVMVADLLHGAREGAVFAVVTDTRAQAEALAAAARANWDGAPSPVTRRTMAEHFGGAMQADLHEIDGIPVLTIGVYGPRNVERPFWQNQAYVSFNRVLMTRDLAWLSGG